MAKKQARQAKPKKQTVWVYMIHHKFGGLLRMGACTTEALAKEAIYGFVADNWDGDMPEDEKMPSGHKEACDAYFDAHDGCRSEHEYADIQKVEVQTK